MAFEEILNDDKPYVAPVTIDNTVGDVDEAAKKIQYNETVALRESAQMSDPSAGGGNSDASLFMDIALEATGMKMVGTAVEFVDERMSDKASMGDAPQKGSSGDSLFGAISKTIEQDVLGANRSPGTYASPKLSGNELIARSNIVSESVRMESPTRLDGKDKFTETKAWEGKDTKVAGMQQTKDIVLQRAMQYGHLHDNVMNVRREHSAMLGRAQHIAPSMGLGSGPSINPRKLLNEAEDDWEQRGS